MSRLLSPRSRVKGSKEPAKPSRAVSTSSVLQQSFPEDEIFRKGEYYTLYEILDKMVNNPGMRTAAAKKALLSYYPEFTTGMYVYVYVLHCTHH